MQLDIHEFRRGSRQHWSHQSRFEFLEQPHRLERHASLFAQAAGVLFPTEQPLVRYQRRLYFSVLWQERPFNDAIPFRRLALRQVVILYPMLRHQSGGFLRNGSAQVIGSRRGSLRHDRRRL